MDTSNALLETRVELADRSIIIFGIISPFLLGLSLYRQLFSGWNNIIILYTFVTITSILFLIFRKKIPVKFKYNMIIVMLFIVSLASFFKIGVAGQGSLILVLTLLYTMMFYGWKYLKFAKIIILFVLIFISLANFLSWIAFSPNPNTYLLTPLNISIYLIFTGVYIYLIIIVTGSFLKALNIQANIEHDDNLSLKKELNKRNNIENELKSAQYESEKSNKAKTDFLSSMSHELRTPMNAILGFSQIMRDDTTISDKNKSYINEILRAGDHLLELINEVLDLSKVESGRIELLVKPVEVDSVINECLVLMEVLAKKRNIAISKKGETGTVVSVDETRLKQVLLNLISNSIKYNHDSGSVAVDVQIIDKKILRISVKDSGYGIPKDQLSEIFQPFNRLNHGNSKIEGTGIGLTLTKRIVELMNGQIDMISEIGKGSTFWVDFPIEHSQEYRPLKGLRDNNTDLLYENKNALYSILYIDDNPSNIKLVEEIINQRKDIQFISSHTPELGFELAQTRHFDIIFMDIDQNSIDSYQILEIFKADTEINVIPIIALTDKTGPRYIEYGKAVFDEYLSKPLNVDKFLQTLDWFLKDSLLGVE